MRSVFSGILALLAFLGGLLVALPRLHERFWTLQLIITEWNVLPTASGILAAVIGRRRWMRVAGVLGIILALVPYLRLRAALREMDASIRRVWPSNSAATGPVHLPSQFSSIRGAASAAVAAHDVIFAQTPQYTLKLDVYQPVSRLDSQERFPAIITVHGGSWMRGDKGGHFRPHHRHLASCGFVVFDIQYRLSHEVHWPEQLEDIWTAVRWVKGQAPLYNVDSQKVALLGRSAGGHLALHAAYRAGDGEQVAAVIALYPPVEPRLWQAVRHSSVVRLLRALPDEAPDRYTDASVLTHVNRDVPPTLLIHGVRDELVQIEHSELLHNYLVAAGVPAALLRIPWARHGFDAVTPGLAARAVQHYIAYFLRAVLYAAPEDHHAG